MEENVSGCFFSEHSVHTILREKRAMSDIMTSTRCLRNCSCRGLDANGVWTLESGAGEEEEERLFVSYKKTLYTCNRQKEYETGSQRRLSPTQSGETGFRDGRGGGVSESEAPIWSTALGLRRAYASVANSSQHVPALLTVQHRSDKYIACGMFRGFSPNSPKP